jgi:hypothetical protein
MPRGAQFKPVEALEAWLAVAGTAEGPVCVSIGKGGRIGRKRLSDKVVAEIIKRCAAMAGLDPRSSPGTRYEPTSSRLKGYDRAPRQSAMSNSASEPARLRSLRIERSLTIPQSLTRPVIPATPFLRPADADLRYHLDGGGWTGCRA